MLRSFLFAHMGAPPSRRDHESHEWSSWICSVNKTWLIHPETSWARKNLYLQQFWQTELQFQVSAAHKRVVHFLSMFREFYFIDEVNVVFCLIGILIFSCCCISFRKSTFIHIHPVLVPSVTFGFLQERVFICTSGESDNCCFSHFY